MKSKSSQVTNSNIHFNEVRTRNFFPGAFEIIDIADRLLENRLKSIENNRNAGIKGPTNDDWSIFGILSSRLILLGHTTELLLKFKLQLDGREIPPKHNLSVLFGRLSENSKKAIESVYKTLKNIKRPSDPQWPTVDALFKSHPEYHVDWRYVVESNKDKLDAPLPFLKLAAESIHNTL